MSGSTGFQPASDWGTWAQGGHFPPVDDSQNSGFNSFLANASPADLAQLAKSLTTLGPQPALPPSGGSISGNQTPPTIPDYAAHPAAALSDFMAAPSPSFASASAPPPLAPPQAPSAAPNAPQPDTYSAAQMAPAAPPTPPASAPLLSDRAAPTEVRGFNFGNIRPPGATAGFNTYGSPQDGVAAMANQLAINQDAHGLTTLRQQLTRWAPKGDGNNDPDAYAATVGKLAGFEPDAPLNFKDPAVLSKVIPAMAQVEQGKPMGVGSDILTAGIQAGLDAHSKGGSINPAGAPPAQATVATNTDNAPPPPGLPGQAPDDVMSLLKSSLYGKDQLQLPGGSKLLALAGGILSGHSLGQGLGKGFENLNQMQVADIANKRASNAQMMQLANIGLLNNVRTAQLGLSAGRLANSEANTGIHQQTADNGSRRTDFTTGGGPAMVKDNYAQAREIDADGEKAMQTIPLIENYKAALASGAAPGTDVIQRFKRAIALRTGMDIGDANPSSVQLSDMLVRQLQANQVQTMRGLGLRTQNEFNLFRDQVSGLDTNPGNAAAILAPIENSAKRDVAIYQRWHDPATDQASMLTTPQGVANFVSPFMAQAAAAQGVGTGAPAAPSMQPRPGGGLQPKPGSVLRYDAQGNLIQ